jgi:AbrB family looped-hinge helix DNA binding protein
MATTVLSSKGQIIIPNPIRTAHQWEPGQRFEAIDTGDGVLLRPAGPFPKTDIEEVVSSLGYSGRPKTLADMQAAVRRGAEESSHDRS